MDGSRRFAIRYSPRFRWLASVTGLGPSSSLVELDREELLVKMGWAFRATIPRSSMRAVRPGRPGWYGIGVHANLKFDTWLVNGSAKGVVWLDLDPPARAWTAGIPVRVRRLGLGLKDPDGFLAGVAGPSAT